MLTREIPRQVANAALIPLCAAYNLLPRPETKEIGSLARSTEPLLAAAGWAFSIWLVIFAWQVAYAAYQALPSQRANPTLRRIGWHTALNAALAAGWTALFTLQQFALAWVVMVATFLNLLAVELRLHDDARTGKELWLVRLPFAINFGWISCALLLNTSQLVHGVLGWDEGLLSPLGWAMALTVVAAVLGLVMAVFRKNLAYGAVVVWALVAVFAYRRTDVPMLAATALVCAGVVAIALVAEAVALSRGWIDRSVAPRPQARPF